MTDAKQVSGHQRFVGLLLAFLPLNAPHFPDVWSVGVILYALLVGE